MKTNKILKWTPRVLSVLFTIFISLFALDVFNEGYSLPEALLALTMHSIPTLFVAFVTYISWKNPRFGGILFILLAILTIFAFDTYEQIPSFLTITMIPLATGILFVLSGNIKSNSTKRTKTKKLK
jgi:TctA family transporter